MDRDKLAYWDLRASRPAGRPLPAPIRPAPGDIAFWESRLSTHCGRRKQILALLLGVTPALATLRWPPGTSLLALDWSSGMIRRAWPGSGLPEFAAPVRGDWRQMPLAGASRDLVIGDGCYAALATFADCAALNEEAWRVLRPGAWYCLRCYLRPESPEPLDRLFAELRAGRVGEFEIFIWRLAMALHGPGRVGVCMDEVWRAWHAQVPDTRALLAQLGWSEQAYANIAQWEGLRIQMPLPTLSEARDMLAPRFEILECSFGDYEMGDRCARLVMRKR